MNGKIPIAIGMAIAVLLQILLAPVITIGSAMPDFVLAYSIALAFAGKGRTFYLTAFLGGLAFDLVGYSPVGAMAAVCVLAMFACSTVVRNAGGDGIAIPLVMIAVSCIVFECIYGFLMMACGIDVALLDAFAFRILPCALYDIVIAIAAYLLLARFVFGDRNANEMTIIEGGLD